MSLDRPARDADWIAAHVPHRGAMCLLEAVLSWDETELVCQAHSHRLSAHPLRHRGRLGIMAGVEYAAQAMALHRALHYGGGPAEQGFLVSVRDLIWTRPWLDEAGPRLEVVARRLAGSDHWVSYDFILRDETSQWLTGRASAMLVNGDEA